MKISSAAMAHVVIQQIDTFIKIATSRLADLVELKPFAI